MAFSDETILNLLFFLTNSIGRRISRLFLWENMHRSLYILLLIIFCIYVPHNIYFLLKILYSLNWNSSPWNVCVYTVLKSTVRAWSWIESSQVQESCLCLKTYQPSTWTGFNFSLQTFFKLLFFISWLK